MQSRPTAMVSLKAPGLCAVPTLSTPVLLLLGISSLIIVPRLTTRPKQAAPEARDEVRSEGVKENAKVFSMLINHTLATSVIVPMALEP